MKWSEQVATTRSPEYRPSFGRYVRLRDTEFDALDALMVLGFAAHGDRIAERIRLKPDATTRRLGRMVAVGLVERVELSGGTGGSTVGRKLVGYRPTRAGLTLFVEALEAMDAAVAA